MREFSHRICVVFIHRGYRAWMVPILKHYLHVCETSDLYLKRHCGLRYRLLNITDSGSSTDERYLLHS